MPKRSGQTAQLPERVIPQVLKIWLNPFLVLFWTANIPSSGIFAFTNSSYEDPYRRVALSICGCGYSIELGKPEPSVEDSLESVISKLEFDGKYERAAGLSLFYNADIPRAVKTLEMSSDEKLKLVATTLAGYSGVIASGSDISVWKELCKSLGKDATNPYIRYEKLLKLAQFLLWYRPETGEMCWRTRLCHWLIMSALLWDTCPMIKYLLFNLIAFLLCIRAHRD